MWSETRMVTKVATVSLHGNVYEVDAALVGSKVEVVFDPFDLTTVEIRFHGRSMGAGIPVVDRSPLPPAGPSRGRPGTEPDGHRLPRACRLTPRGRGRPRPSTTPSLPLPSFASRRERRRATRRKPSDHRPAALALGLLEMPFSKDLAPSMLYTHASHAEAVARISWCVDERALGLVTGEVGSGKTVAMRAALSGLDASRTTVIYLGNPSVGARGLYSTIVSTLGGTPRFHRASLIPQAAEALATEESERGRKVVSCSTKPISSTPSSSRACVC